MIFEVFSSLQNYCEAEKDHPLLIQAIDETAWAPVLYFLLDANTTQEQVDTAFSLEGGPAGWLVDYA